MKMKIILGLSLSLLTGATAFAQSSEYERVFAPRGAEARVTFSIPFGGDSKNPNSKPQLALVGRHYNDNRDSLDWDLRNPIGQQSYRETRLAITLSAQPDVFLNNQLLLPSSHDETHLSDGVKDVGKVALVAGAVMVTVVVIALVKLGDCGPDSDGYDKC